MSEKIQPIELKTRRENLGLSVKEICKIFKLETKTWELWEQKPIAPYFFSFALRYLEENIEDFREKKKTVKTSSHQSKPYNLSFRGKFLAKIEKLENSDCLFWTGASGGMRDGNQTLSPRRAAYKAENLELPSGNISLNCGNEKCVNIAHFEISEKRSGGRKFISDDLKNLVRFELSKPNPNQKAIAKNLKISVGTVSKIANEK